MTDDEGAAESGHRADAGSGLSSPADAGSGLSSPADAGSGLSSPADAGSGLSSPPGPGPGLGREPEPPPGPRGPRGPGARGAHAVRASAARIRGGAPRQRAEPRTGHRPWPQRRPGHGPASGRGPHGTRPGAAGDTHPVRGHANRLGGGRPARDPARARRRGWPGTGRVRHRGPGTARRPRAAGPGAATPTDGTTPPLDIDQIASQVYERIGDKMDHRPDTAQDTPPAEQAIMLRDKAPELYDLWLKIAQEKAATINYVQRAPYEVPERLAQSGRPRALSAMIVVLAFCGYLASLGGPGPYIGGLIAILDLLVMLALFFGLRPDHLTDSGRPRKRRLIRGPRLSGTQMCSAPRVPDAPGELRITAGSRRVARQHETTYAHLREARRQPCATAQSSIHGLWRCPSALLRFLSTPAQLTWSFTGHFQNIPACPNRALARLGLARA